MMKRALCLVALFLLLFPGAPADASELSALSAEMLLFPGARAGELSVRPPESIIPYAQNRFAVYAPEGGLFSLRLKSRAVDWLVADGVRLSAGRQEIFYDGLSANGEPIHTGRFTLEAALSSGGRQYAWRGEARAARPAPTLQYVLLRNDLLYLDGGSLQVDLYRTGTLKVEVTLRKEGEPADEGKAIRFLQDRTHSLLFSWDGKVGGKTIAPGSYTLRFTAEKGMLPHVELPFTAVDGAPPRHSLAVTPRGNFLPETLDDAAVWQAMMAPLTVVKGRALIRHNVYERPDTASPVLGKVSGETAGLDVLALEGAFARVGAWRYSDGSYMEGYIQQDRLTTLYPNRHWGLLLNKKEQTMTVYFDGAVLGRVRVSTGMMAARNLMRESRAGAFALGQRLPSFDNLGYRYRYAMRVDGGNLIHQVGYPIDSAMNFELEDSRMGSKASHGCIRVDRFPGEGGINAFWMWTHLPSTTKLLVLDDREERHARMAALGLTQPD